MKKYIPESIYKSRVIQISIGGAITIFLGAIGSGLWELFLGPLLHKASDFTLTTISSLFHGYVDFIYRGVSRNPSDYLALLPYTLIFTVLISFPWFGFLILLIRTNQLIKDIQSPIEKDNSDLTPEKLSQKVRVTRKRILFIMLPLTIISTFIYLQEVIQTIHSRKAAIFIERSIEIVTPVIDQKTRLNLRAQFRAIETAKDFYSLEDKLRKIASDNNVKLPEFESIR
jgi:TRAP-type C4-dicarboxylate transport system permease small subunit